MVQVEEMVKATEYGKKTEMRTDVFGNLFFVKTGNLKNPVFVCFVERNRYDGWNVHALQLSHNELWFAQSRLLVGNLDAPKLGL